MDDLIGLAVWIAPLTLPPLSYLSYRFVPFRAQRMCAYLVVLTVAIFFDILRISFRPDVLDVAASLALIFMVLELCWLPSRFAGKKPLVVVLGIVIPAIGFVNWEWISAGPRGVGRFRAAEVADTHRTDNTHYVVKDFACPRCSPPYRVFRLVTNTPHLPLEQTIKSYEPPSGYAATPFTFQWNPTAAGVRLDLLPEGEYVLWTMGEGF
jgi:hypothetical protein